MSNITYNIRLQTQSTEDHNLLLAMLLQHQQVWNHISQDTFNHRSKGIDKKIIYDRNYKRCRKLFPDCPSQAIIRAKDSVYATYKALKTAKRLNDLEQPCELTNLSIRLDKRLYTFLDGNRIKLTTTGPRITCSYRPYSKFSELLSKYSLCDPLVFYRNGSFWLAASFEVPEPVYIPNTILGVDLGMRRLAVTSAGLAITDKDFLRQKRRLRFLKRRLRSLSATKKSHSSRRKLKKLSQKERNKNKNLCHHVANRLLATESNTIVLEDLSSLKKTQLRKDNFKKGKSSKNRLSQVPFGMIREVMTYKAPLRGKRVVTVNPAFTSQKDHRGFPGGERKGCRFYASDGTVFDADWNASINIAAKWLRSKEAHGISHPISFGSPFDGGLNFLGRLLSTSQSSPISWRQTQPSLAVG